MFDTETGFPEYSIVFEKEGEGEKVTMTGHVDGSEVDTGRALVIAAIMHHINNEDLLLQLINQFMEDKIKGGFDG